jgi:citrate lyase beta subunit
VDPPQVEVDRDEILVIGELPDPDLEDAASDEDRQVARRATIEAFREHTRETRMRIAREAESEFGRKVSWGVRVGDLGVLFTHLAAPAMTRLRMRERRVLDTLVEAGIARSRADALAWCVRLVGQHEADWLADLRAALTEVNEVRRRGPSA